MNKMPASIKGILHTLLTIISLYVPVVIDHSGIGAMTVGTIVAMILNWGLSHTVPTTTGASATQ